MNPKAGLTFAGALRSILRSDPDVVLLGEIRDHETAQIAIEAALTGHLVLSTLHTNDAPSAVTRLIEMGIEPFLVGSALDCVVAQRLARRLCSQVQGAVRAERGRAHRGAVPVEPRGRAPDAVPPGGLPGVLAHRLQGPHGDPRGHAGHARRSSGSRVAHASAAEIGRVAREQGMIALREDGWAKVLLGETSLEEVLRVVA